MKKSKFLVLFVTLVIVISCVGCYFAFAANDVAVTVTGTGNGTYSVSVNGNIATAYDGMVNKGDEVTLTATGEDFLYWIDGNKNTIKSATYTFTAEFDTSFEACFKPASGSMVVYRNTNLTQQILGKATHESASDFNEHLAEKANKYGFVFKGWSLSVEQIKDKITGGEKYIEVNPVYDAPEGIYAISVNGGTVNGLASGTYSNNELVEIKAESVAGKVFCHWVDFNGNIVSDKESFELYAYKSDVFTAVYTNDCGKTHAPEVRLELYLANGVIHSRAQMFVPTGYTTAEYGLIYTKGETPSSLTLKLENVGGIVKKVSYTAKATVLANHFNFDENASNQFVYACAYMICNGEVIYSNDGKASFIENLREDDNEDTINDIFGLFDSVSGLKAANNYSYDNSASLATYENRDITSFTLACQKYALEGYSLYGKVNELGPVKSATYVKGDALAHIYYSSLENELAIVTSATEGKNLPAPVAFSGDKSKTSVTQLPGSSGNTSGMGYIIRLADGSFIVYDGGYTAETNDIYNALVELNGGSESGIIIRAWLLTHGDGDHYQALQSFLTNHASKVTFECLMTAPIKDNFNGSEGTGSGVATTEAKARAAKIKICRVHTGMVFNFCDVELEILMAPESIFAYSNPSQHKAYTDPNYEFYGRGDLVGYQNETSIVSRIKASDGRKTFIVLGDAGHAVADKLLAMYGKDSATSYLKSDICQVAHHGCETFSLEGYKVINADIWYYPSSTYLYSNMSTEKGPQYTNSSLKGRNWYVLQELNKMGTKHILREAGRTGKDNFTNGDNYQSLNK